ncbi:hypothetical protein, partial [Escherichia coli]|uniref:hypothetical protein n=1 Tax=Escherichia coli TaxID=562 RepID=UPI0022843B5B
MTSAVISSALTAWAVAAGVSNQSLDFQSAVNSVKDAFSRIPDALSFAYEKALSVFRERTLPSLSDLVDIQTIDETHVAFTSLADQT